MDRSPSRSQLLNLDLIADAALDEGIATFTMPAIAARLGVAPTELHQHVRGREHVQVRAIERAALSVEWPDPELPWRDLLRGIAHTVWTICQRYSGYDVAAMSPPGWPAGLIDQVTPYIASLHRQGATIEDASVAVEIAGNHALAVSRRHARSGLPADPTAPAWDNRRLEIALSGLETRLLR